MIIFMGDIQARSNATTLRATVAFLFVFRLVLVTPVQAQTVSISGFTPGVGYRGATVRLEGSGFTHVTGVKFGGTSAAVRVVSDSVIDATIPAGATSGPVSVVSPQGSVASAAAFFVQADVVLILTDDQRWDALEFPTLQTEMIAKGVTFSQAFVPNPICCPSRASILTGRYSHGTDVYKNNPPHGGFDTFTGNGSDSSTMATWLRSAGYTTGFIGKYLNGYGVGDTDYVPPGWDRWVAMALAGVEGGDVGGYYDYVLSVDGVDTSFGSAEEDYSTDVLAAYATDFIAEAPAHAPLLLYFAPRAPHKPTTVAARHTAEFSQLAPLASPNLNEADVSDKPSYVRSLPVLSSSQMQSNQALRRRHYRTLLAVDEALAAILRQLEESGRLQDTMIVFMSDNGLLFGEHRWKGKEVPYEESIRVPFIVRYDPLTGGQASTVGEMVLNVDVAPTFAELAGVPATTAQGLSLLGLIDGSTSTWRTDFLLEHVRTAVNGIAVPAYCGVRTTSAKYVRYADGQEELYDLLADPFEMQNLAAEPAYADEKAALHQRTRELCVPTPPKYAPF